MCNGGLPYPPSISSKPTQLLLHPVVACHIGISQNQKLLDLQPPLLSTKKNVFISVPTTDCADNTDRVVYTYSMNNSQWTTLPRGSNRTSFINLPPGSYHFALKAKDGVIESDVKDITIHIAQPWWNSGRV